MQCFSVTLYSILSAFSSGPNKLSLEDSQGLQATTNSKSYNVHKMNFPIWNGLSLLIRCCLEKSWGGSKSKPNEFFIILKVVFIRIYWVFLFQFAKLHFFPIKEELQIASHNCTSDWLLCIIFFIDVFDTDYILFIFLFSISKFIVDAENWLYSFCFHKCLEVWFMIYWNC